MTDGNGRSALDRAGGHAAVHFLLEEKEEDKDGDDGDDDAGTDVVVLVAVGAGEGVQRHRNGLQVAGLQVQVGHVVLVVDADALQQAAGDDGRFQQRQQVLEEHAEVGAAIQDGALVQSPRQVLKELQEREST